MINAKLYIQDMTGFILILTYSMACLQSNSLCLFSTLINNPKSINNIVMSLNMFTKPKATTLAKLAAMPRFRDPRDLLNEPHLPYDLQTKQMNGQLTFKGGKFLSNEHYQLCRANKKAREDYLSSEDKGKRGQIAGRIFGVWDKYLSQWTAVEQVYNVTIQFKLTQEQRQRVYEAMLTAKERNQQRLALHRLIKFGYEYSQAYKVDIPLNPVVMMKMVHPHFGYFNNFPQLPHLKYTHSQLFELLEQFVVASHIREEGYTLHSSELVSFIFWKVLTQNQAEV